MKHLWSQLCVVFASFAMMSSSWATYSLDQFVDFAQKGPALGEARARVNAAMSQQDLAAAQAWPSGTLDVFAGPVPGVQGGLLDGKTDFSQWGLAYGSRLEANQPLYTWGAIAAGRDAAASGSRAASQLLERDHWKLRVEIAELYYGYQLAFGLALLAEDSINLLRKAESKSEGRIRTRLVTLRLEVEARLEDAKKSLEQARAAMSWKTGLPMDQLKWDRVELFSRELTLPSLDSVQIEMKSLRPELKAMDAEVEARGFLVQVEEGKQLPILAGVARAEMVESPTRKQISSAYISDPLNHTQGFLGLGIRWNLGFLEKSARVAEARSKWIEARARRTYWSVGIETDVLRTWTDAQAAARALEKRKQALDEIKKAAKDVSLGWTLGTFRDGKELLEILSLATLTEKNYLESVYSWNLAVTKLEQAVGRRF
jgi:outer membrane protein TolC